MKITVLCYDMSHNCLGRAQILALALKRYYDVEIVGFASDGCIWEPLRNDKTLDYKIIKFKDFAKRLTGDVLYASKTKGSSFGLGIYQKILFGKPLILDIDDWDYGLQADGKMLHKKLYEIARFWNINSLAYNWLLERMTGLADAITTSNTFLKNMFGGKIIPHFRDTDQFDPAKFVKIDSELEKYDLKINNKIILFLGTPRKHKGIMDLVDALGALGRKDLILLIVGASERDKGDIPKRNFVKVLGLQPFAEIPKFLAMADVIVLFQSSTMSSQGQLPAKVFDAMSMAKPVIASRVSDLPKVLNGCGEIVTPGDISELSQKIDYLLDHPDYAKELGRKARERCIEKYSCDAIAPKLRDVVESVLAKDRQNKNK